MTTGTKRRIHTQAHADARTTHKFVFVNWFAQQLSGAWSALPRRHHSADTGTCDLECEGEKWNNCGPDVYVCVLYDSENRSKSWPAARDTSARVPMPERAWVGVNDNREPDERRRLTSYYCTRRGGGQCTECSRVCAAFLCYLGPIANIQVAWRRCHGGYR